MTRSGIHSMAAPLTRVLVCAPEAAGWCDPERSARWSALGYHHPPRPEPARRQHQALCRALEAAGARLERLASDASLSLDAVYTHDTSLPTNGGALLLRPGKPTRRGEPDRHGRLYSELGIPILGRLEEPACAEAGDLVWLDERTLLAGRGYRTNAAGIAALRAQLAPLGAELIEAPLPHGGGPEVCLHLMSILSVLDERRLLVDLEWLAVSTVELLHERGFELIGIAPGERQGLACNVLALGGGRLLAIEENRETNARLEEQGFEVYRFPGDELCWNGSGGPTCLTRPLERLE
jgi:N-dimethylarginine dimethylaminohydrolase